MPLEKEMETYFRELPRLLREHPGEFVLIHGDRVDSFWKTEDEAYEAGCDRFVMAPFLVKEIQESEPVLESPVEVMR